MPGGALLRSLALLAAFCASCASLLLMSAAPSAQAAACPNEALRVEQGAAGQALPECRAYELVTPSGANPFIATDGEVQGQRASTAGDGLAYWTRYPAEEAVRSGNRYLATRGSAGWSVEDLTPQESTRSSLSFDCEQAWDFSDDLSKGILSDGWNALESNETNGGICGESEETLAPGAPKGYGNLFLREGGVGIPFRLVNSTPAGVTPANALLTGYTSDLSRIIFSERAPLTPGAPSGPNLYEWSDGVVHLVSVLPSGEPVAGSLAYGRDDGDPPGINLAPTTHAFSTDAEEVFFYADGNLYLRKNAAQPPTASGTCSVAEPDNACTIQVDLKQGGTGTSGGGIFWGATADASKVFFSAESPLTADSTATAGKPDLFELNLESGLLRDRTHTAAGERPSVLGISGLSEDGSLLYFVALGALSGSGANGNGEVAKPHSANLYLLDGAEVSFVATLDREEDSTDWEESGRGTLATATSPDGEYLAFTSTVRLTAFANTPADPLSCAGPTCREAYLYDARTKQIECLSCASDGAPPTADTRLPNAHTFSGKSAGGPAYRPRQVFDDGRVFFTTENALVPEDTNGAKDVYEDQAGDKQLISTGTAIGDSVFYDSDPGGANVFFATSQGILRSDTDNRLSIYDARVDGGFPEPPPAPACEGEACRGPGATAPNPSTPGSANFAGVEEGVKQPKTAPCKPGFAKRHGKCVKEHPKKKHPKKHPKKNSKSKNHQAGKHGSSKRRNSK